MSDTDKYKALRERLNLEPNEMIGTSKGALDVFKVEGGRIYFGFVATGERFDEPLDEFIKRFDGLIYRKKETNNA